MRQQRQVVLEQAFQAHPERFVRGHPQPARPPEAVWINPPQTEAATAPLAAMAGPWANVEPTVQPSRSPVAVAQPADLPYAALGRTEDRATLRSDSSAVSADETDGQSCSHSALSTSLLTPSVSSLKAINRTVRGGELRSKRRSPTPPLSGDRQHIKPLH